MENVLDVAFYVVRQYFEKMRDEQPLFEEEFQGWKYGPVCISVRKAYRQSQFKSDGNFKCVGHDCKDIVARVLKQYGSKNSWSLSDITHFEYSWIQSRRGLKEGENGSNLMALEDIRVDAKRIRERRKALTQRKMRSTIHIPIVNAADVEEPEECIDVAAEIKKIEKDLKRRNKSK